MSWQDVVLAAGGFVIAAGIVPTILSSVKPPITTSGTIFVVLVVSSVAFASLGLWLTAAGVVLQCVLWGTVLAQTLLARRYREVALSDPVLAAPTLGFEAYQPADAPAPSEAS